MIIFIINNFGISIFKAEGNTPISLYGYRIRFFSFAFQLVESKSWDLHILNSSGLIKLGQDKSQPFSMLEKVLEKKVDLGISSTLKPLVKETAEKDVIYV